MEIMLLGMPILSPTLSKPNQRLSFANFSHSFSLIFSRFCLWCQLSGHWIFFWNTGHDDEERCINFNAVLSTFKYSMGNNFVKTLEGKTFYEKLELTNIQQILSFTASDFKKEHHIRKISFSFCFCKSQLIL